MGEKQDVSERVREDFRRWVFRDCSRHVRFQTIRSKESHLLAASQIQRFSATMIFAWSILFTQAGVINYLVYQQFIDASFPSFVMRELGKDNFWNLAITKKSNDH